MNKTKKRKKDIGIIILILIALILLLTATIVILNLSNREEEPKSSSKINSIDELLKFYDCTNISIQSSSDESFNQDIFLTFGEDLWKDNNSNEGYFGNIIYNLASLLDYDNFRLIDSSRELVIAVLCDKENKQVGIIYINGQINYFQNEKAKRVAKEEYKRLDTTEFTIDSEEINTLINVKWDPEKINFGTYESRFEDYDIYFDEGIEIKTIAGKIYNIIFTEKYNGAIINGLKVNDTREEIISSLGEPLFESNEIVGYKGEKIYVFFSENEVSVYRIEDDYNQKEFLKVWNIFNETKNAKKFINEITDVWPDFDKYISDSNFVSLQYTLKGIKVEFNTTGENGIILYNNYSGELQDGLTLDTITDENLPANVYLNTDIDLVYLEEENRIFNRLNMYSDEYISMMEYDSTAIPEDPNEENVNIHKFTNRKSKEFNMIFTYVMEDEIYGIKFISKNREYPNSELIRHKQIYRYGWIDDEQFIYSVKNTGIYLYNAKTRELKTLIEGIDEFYIKGIRENKLIYDDKQELNLV